MISMKKTVSILMVAIMVILSACGNREAIQTTTLLDEYLKNIDEYETPVREAGDVASYIYMDEKLSVGILYPKTGIVCLDNAVNDWVEKTANEYKQEIAQVTDLTDKAELSVFYESYRVGDIVSIKMSGTFLSPHMAHPEDFVKTFIADASEEKLLYADDIFKDEGKNKIIEMLVAETGAEKDENILSNLVLINDGIEITLNRGEYLPMSDGTKTVEFKYDQIGHLMNIFLEIYEEESESVTEEATQEVTQTATEMPTEKIHPEYELDPNKPMIALTFDDGPSAHTERLLDIFETYGGKGTFFVLGNLIDGRESTLKRISQEGHEIGNHGWNHRQMTKHTEDEVTDQIMMTRAKIYDVTGMDCFIVRPPYGACNDSVKKVGAELGVSFVNWSVDTLDWKTKDAQAVYYEIIKNATDGAIILCHDLHKTTVDAMETVIPKLIEEGYQLVTVSELMSYSKNGLEPGKMYYRR